MAPRELAHRQPYLGAARMARLDRPQLAQRLVVAAGPSERARLGQRGAVGVRERALGRRRRRRPRLGRARRLRRSRRGRWCTGRQQRHQLLAIARIPVGIGRLGEERAQLGRRPVAPARSVVGAMAQRDLEEARLGLVEAELRAVIRRVHHARRAPHVGEAERVRPLVHEDDLLLVQLARTQQRLALALGQRVELAMQLVVLGQIVQAAHHHVLAEVARHAEVLDRPREHRQRGDQPDHEVDVVAAVRRRQVGDQRAHAALARLLVPAADLHDLEVHGRPRATERVHVVDEAAGARLPLHRLPAIVGRRPHAHAHRSRAATRALVRRAQPQLHRRHPPGGLVLDAAGRARQRRHPLLPRLRQ